MLQGSEEFSLGEYWGAGGRGGYNRVSHNYVKYHKEDTGCILGYDTGCLKIYS